VVQSEKMPLIDARNVTKNYSAGSRSIIVLEGVSLAVSEGEFLVIEGASGCGKTTLISLLSGLDRPTSGRIHFDGRDITDLGEDDLAPLRAASIGFVFQNFHLVPSLTVRENVMFPAQLANDREAAGKTDTLLDKVGLSHRALSYPHQLSGGEKQRTAICRALVNCPRVIFADEPTGNLDSANGRAVLELLLALRRERSVTLVMVTHNREMSAAADRAVRLRDGRLEGEGRE
jgi:putative ABC transport system ATP-binding protein